MPNTRIPKYWISVLWAIALLGALELSLQVRAHLRYGTSIFNLASAQPTYVYDADLGLKLLRKNAVISGSQATIETNSIGLRSAEIPSIKPLGEIRIGLVGASSVMGTYTRNNEETLSYRLQHHLTPMKKESKIHVINAGIAGHTLRSQKNMIAQVLVPLDIDLLVLYPGFNNLSGYCKNGKKNESSSYVLHSLKAPPWLLTVELITKNTVWLRETRARGKEILDPKEINSDAYEKSISSLLGYVQREEIPMLVITNPRSYSRGMPEAEQLQLSETARYYNPCFDVGGLHDLYDRHNDLIEQLAEAHDFDVLRLDKIMPPGPEYFGDATHFSVKGTDHAAKLISSALSDLLEEYPSNTNSKSRTQ